MTDALLLGGPNDWEPVELVETVEVIYPQFRMLIVVILAVEKGMGVMLRVPVGLN